MEKWIYFVYSNVREKNERKKNPSTNKTRRTMKFDLPSVFNTDICTRTNIVSRKKKSFLEINTRKCNQ